MPVPGIDAEKIVATLQEHDVAFVVVGGFAVDVDITPETSQENLRRLASALNDLEAGIRTGSETVPVPGGLTAEMIEQMSVLNLNTIAGPLDLTILPAGTSGYDDLIEDASEIAFGEVMVPTASLEDVARSKEAAGRSKDLKTLPAIMAHIERMQR
jgi:hypothetical protein